MPGANGGPSATGVKNGSALAGLLLCVLAPLAKADTGTATQTLALAVNEVAVVDVSGSPGLLALDPVPGPPLPSVSDSSTYLRYTSVVPKVSGKVQSRNIQARLSSGRLPRGTQLRLLAAAPAGSKVGQVGTSAGQIVLTSTSKNLLTGVKSGWTGTGGLNGSQLTYTFAVTDPSALGTAASATLIITLTLIDPF